VKKIEEIVPEVAYEKVWKIWGGQLAINAASLELSTGRVGTIVSFENCRSTGYLFKAKRFRSVKRDFSRLVVSDGGRQTLEVPRSVSCSLS
jgi:hypothetical protein